LRDLWFFLTGTDFAAACQGGFFHFRDKRLDRETPRD
jgi:hypothetical protein